MLTLSRFFSSYIWFSPSFTLGRYVNGQEIIDFQHQASKLEKYTNMISGIISSIGNTNLFRVPEKEGSSMELHVVSFFQTFVVFVVVFQFLFDRNHMSRSFEVGELIASFLDSIFSPSHEFFGTLLFQM